MMVSHNTSTYGTAFTISIDAAEGVTTGVSAPARVKAIKAVINPNGKPEDLASPGHMFPLVAKKGGVLERDGHTEASMEHDLTCLSIEDLIAYRKEHNV